MVNEPEYAIEELMSMHFGQAACGEEACDSVAQAISPAALETGARLTAENVPVSGLTVSADVTAAPAPNKPSGMS